MPCISPIIIRTKNIDYETGEIISDGYKDDQIVRRVPCGKCYYCLQKKRGYWLSRMEYEARKSVSAHFVTLTYDDEHLPFDENGNPMVSKRDIQLFFKRLRKNTGSEVKYFCVAEYGPQTHRPHYHAIIFNLSKIKVNGIDVLVDKEEVHLNIVNNWKNGNVSVFPALGATIGYVCKYHTIPKDMRQPKEFKSTFTLMSRRPGIGDGYVDDMQDWHNGDIDKFYFQTENGYKRVLPRYWYERLYTPLDREARAEILEARTKEKENNMTYKQFVKDRQKRYATYKDFERKTIKQFKQRNKI